MNSETVPDHDRRDSAVSPHQKLHPQTASMSSPSRPSRAGLPDGSLIGLPGAGQTLDGTQGPSFGGPEYSDPDFFSAFLNEDAIENTFDESFADIPDTSQIANSAQAQESHRETDSSASPPFDYWTKRLVPVNSELDGAQYRQPVPPQDNQPQYIQPGLLAHQQGYGSANYDLAGHMYPNYPLSMHGTNGVAFPQSAVNQDVAIRGPQASDLLTTQYPDPTTLSTHGQPYHQNWENFGLLGDNTMNPMLLNEALNAHNQQAFEQHSSAPITNPQFPPQNHGDASWQNSVQMQNVNRVATASRRRSNVSYADASNSRDADAHINPQVINPDSPSSQKSDGSFSGSERRPRSNDPSGSNRRSSISLTRIKAGEKPRTRPDRAWVRTNNTTKGETTRTAKINNYVPNYKTHCPLPLGNWATRRYQFEYTGIGEFQKKTMSTRQIDTYIREYPTNKVKGAKLIIWIQKCPADSAFRYANQAWDKCRFRDCPVQLHETGSIRHGHFRVAFDEKWRAYRSDADPFLTAGYAHLYCMERFLDFEEICRVADVRVDARSIAKEPKGKCAFTMAQEPGFGLAENFIEACKDGTLRDIRQFRRYPRHSDYPNGDRKPHENTLTYYLTKAKMDSRAPAQIKQFRQRALRPTQILIHMNDMEIYAKGCLMKKKTSAKNRKNKKKSKSGNEDHSDSSDSEIDEEIKRRFAEVRSQYPSDEKEKKKEKNSEPKTTNKRKRSTSDAGNDRPEWECSDSENESDYEKREQSGVSSGTRRSPRKRSRINYNESDQQAISSAPAMQYEPASQLGTIEEVPASNNTPSEPQPQPALQTNSRRASANSILQLGDNDQLANIENLPSNSNEFPSLEGDTTGMTDADFSRLFDPLERRRSSTMSNGQGIVNTQASGGNDSVSTRTRQASFNNNPVSSSTQYGTNDPPNQLSADTRSSMRSPRVDPCRRTRAASKDKKDGTN